MRPDDLAETLCGSPLYMAPEILRYEKYDAKADLWSIGAILFECVYGRPPFKAQNHIDLLKNIETASGISFSNDIPVSEECKSLIRSLLKRDPALRMSFDDFFLHPFLVRSNEVAEIRQEDVLEGVPSLESALNLPFGENDGEQVLSPRSPLNDQRTLTDIGPSRHGTFGTITKGTSMCVSSQLRSYTSKT